MGGVPVPEEDGSGRKIEVEPVQQVVSCGALFLEKGKGEKEGA